MDASKPEWGRAEMPGGLSERWPRDGHGEPEEPAYLATESQLDMSDALTVNMLEAFGIPCIRRFPHYGGFGNQMLGMSAEGVEIFVPASMLEDAKELMKGDISEDEEL